MCLAAVSIRWSQCPISGFSTYPLSPPIVGVPCSNKMETVHITTALSGAFRWKELPSFTPLSHFPDFLFPVLLPSSFCLGAYHQGSVNVHVENVHLGSSLIDFNECKTEKCHKFTNMGKVKQLELWRQLYVMWLPVRDLENFRPLDFCWTEGTR